MNKKNKGFSLLEVMITLVIVAVGMLGVAGMSLKASLLSLENAQKNEALYLANDIVNRMRANADRLDQYVNSANGIAAEDLQQWTSAIDQKLVAGTGCIYVDNGRVLVAVTWQADAPLGDAIDNIKKRYNGNSAQSMVERASACGSAKYGTQQEFRQAVVVNTFIG